MGCKYSVQLESGSDAFLVDSSPLRASWNISNSSYNPQNSGSPNFWIGLYHADDDDNYIAWEYIHPGFTSGVVTFNSSVSNKLKLDSNYYFKLHSSGYLSNPIRAISNNFIVETSSSRLEKKINNAVSKALADQEIKNAELLAKLSNPQTQQISELKNKILLMEADQNNILLQTAKEKAELEEKLAQANKTIRRLSGKRKFQEDKEDSDQHHKHTNINLNTNQSEHHNNHNTHSLNNNNHNYDNNNEDNVNDNVAHSQVNENQNHHPNPTNLTPNSKHKKDGIDKNEDSKKMKKPTNKTPTASVSTEDETEPHKAKRARKADR